MDETVYPEGRICQTGTGTEKSILLSAGTSLENLTGNCLFQVFQLPDDFVKYGIHF